MDSVTHTVTALALSHAGFNRKTRFATLALVIGANLPDVDVIAWLAGGATYLKYHRGITHSLFGATLLAAALGAALYFFARKAPLSKPGPPLDARWLFAACWTATASHILLDFTNHYGIRPFLPFSGRWYAWDIAFIIDPLLLALMVGGLGVAMLLRLVSEEVGVQKPGLRRGAIFSLCSLAVLWGVRDLAHRRVLTLLDSQTYGQENPLKLGAFPTPANPFAWVGVVETETAFHILQVNALDNFVSPESAQVFRKTDPSPALDAAMATRTGKIFARFARFLWSRVEESEEGYRISLRDMRFYAPNSRRRGFVAEIELDKNLRVVSESFSFSAPAGER